MLMESLVYYYGFVLQVSLQHTLHR